MYIDNTPTPAVIQGGFLTFRELLDFKPKSPTKNSHFFRLYIGDKYIGYLTIIESGKFFNRKVEGRFCMEYDKEYHKYTEMIKDAPNFEFVLALQDEGRQDNKNIFSSQHRCKSYCLNFEKQFQLICRVILDQTYRPMFEKLERLSC